MPAGTSAGRRARRAPPGCRSGPGRRPIRRPTASSKAARSGCRDRPGGARPTLRDRGGGDACGRDRFWPARQGSPRTETPPPETRRFSTSADIEAVVAVALVVCDQTGDFVPDRPPGRPRQAEPGSEAGGIAEREIEAHQHPLVRRPRRRQPIGEQRLGCMAGRRIDQGFMIAAAPADPDAVAADPRHVRRTPIDDHKTIEHQTTMIPRIRRRVPPAAHRRGHRLTLSPAAAETAAAMMPAVDANPLLLLVAGLAIDAWFGDMPAIFSRVPHPVVLAGRAVAFFDRKLNREIRSEASRRVRGILTVLALVGACRGPRAGDRASVPRQPCRRGGRDPADRGAGRPAQPVTSMSPRSRKRSIGAGWRPGATRCGTSSAATR